MYVFQNNNMPPHFFLFKNETKIKKIQPIKMTVSYAMEDWQ